MPVLTPDLVKRLQELRKSPYRPIPICEMQDRIASETRRLELRSSTGQLISGAEIMAIVRMKLELDALYSSWLMEEIE